MPSAPFTAIANASGVAAVTVPPVLSGLQWTVAQSSVESLPTRSGVTCVTTLNGNLVTSTQVVPATAGGTPAINLQAGDTLVYTFAGLTQGDTAKVTLYYNESPWGTPPRTDWV